MYSIDIKSNGIFLNSINNSKKINFLINEFIQCHNSFGAMSTFRKSPGGYYIYLLIISSHYSKNPVCVEGLISLVCPKFCSRQTVKNITASAIEANFITKIIDDNDRRRKLFVPTESTILEFEQWINKTLESF